jgi:hypothetical protein
MENGILFVFPSQFSEQSFQVDAVISVSKNNECFDLNRSSMEHVVATPHQKATAGRQIAPQFPISRLILLPGQFSPIGGD